MVGATILFEPLPIGRLGIRRDNDDVVLASDFSAFAWMIEEFVALGVTTIQIQESAPEAQLLEQMPALLRRRIQTVNDAPELQATALIMDPIYQEIGCRVSQNQLVFDSAVDHTLRSAVARVRHDLYALAVGLNHGSQVAVSPHGLTSALDRLRKVLGDERGRAVAGQISGVIAAYVPLQFDGPRMAGGEPTEIVNAFDQLVNDELYSDFSRSVGSLVNESARRAALSRIRSCVRRMAASQSTNAIVDSVSKIVKVGGTTALPQASSLFSMFQVRALPMLLDLSSARSLALQRWLALGQSAPPLSRAGSQVGDPGIAWLPPLPSASAEEPGSPYVSMGTKGDLLEALIESQGMVDRGKPRN